jgi:carboxyl-terminal processing protease
MSHRARLFVAVVSTSLMAVGSLLNRVMGDTTYGQLSVFGEVIRLVLDAYVEPINLDRTMAGATLGLTDALDGDSAYLTAEELKTQQLPLKESEADIGAVLTRRYAFLMVVSTRPGSPADKAGLRSGDILSAGSDSW